MVKLIYRKICQEHKITPDQMFKISYEIELVLKEAGPLNIWDINRKLDTPNPMGREDSEITRTILKNSPRFQPNFASLTFKGATPFP
jgi:hypothetical protein